MYARPPMKFDNTKYYEILGVSKNSLPGQLKKAYRKAAIKNHPDKGGDPEKFKEIRRAYERLKDPLNRWIYDQYGIDDSWIPGQYFYHSLMISLEDLYNGTSQKINFTRPVLCSKCKGRGYCGASIECSGCQGSGSGDLDSSMIQETQQQRPCNECKGTGEIIDDKNRCQLCNGNRVFHVDKLVEVPVDKGMQSGQKIRVRGEALGGGIVYTLQQKKHPKFKRKGADLFVEHTLSLTEAASGYQFVLTHLDNRQLIIKSQPGESVKFGQMKEINDEGMPMYQRPNMRGKLYIHFNPAFPDPSLAADAMPLELSYPPPMPIYHRMPIYTPAPIFTPMSLWSRQQQTVEEEVETGALVQRV